MIAYYLGIFKLFYFLNRTQQIILTYHNVIPDDYFDNRLHLGVSTSASAFEKQLKIILSRFKITTNFAVPASCMLTFDDGYQNNLSIVAPIFQEKNIQGVFFVPACYFSGEMSLWSDELLLWLSYAPAGKYIILEKLFSLATDQDRQAAWRFLYEQLLNDYSQLSNLKANLDTQYSFVEIKNKLNPELYRLRFEALNAQELEELKATGQLIACHSWRHDILSKLSAEALEVDFIACKAFKEKYNSSYYAYPFGGLPEISLHVIAACEKHGYSAAFINYDSDSKDKYSIGRMSLGNIADRYVIEAKLCGFEKYLKHILRL